MNRILVIIGVLVGMVGLVFTLQGIGILPGSVMTNDIKWAFIGTGMIIVGVGLVAWDNKRRDTTPPSA
jgi:hypothetical protein